MLIQSCWLSDAICGGIQRQIHRVEHPGFIVIMFHNPFQNMEEVQSGGGIPGDRITIHDIDCCIRYFQKIGYRFISPDDIHTLAENWQRSVMLTFDDGYHNCVHVLPILEKYAVPATFFITSNPVLQGTMFWWDAVYRSERQMGKTFVAASAVLQEMARMPISMIPNIIVERYGLNALTPDESAFSPLTPQELITIAKHPLVSIGSHSQDHAVLKDCTTSELEQQIVGAKVALEQLLMKNITTIAYPYGSYDERVIAVVKRAGFKLGFACSEGHNTNSCEGQYNLHRYTPQGQWHMGMQWMRFRSDCRITRQVTKFLSKRSKGSK